MIIKFKWTKINIVVIQSVGIWSIQIIIKTNLQVLNNNNNNIDTWHESYTQNCLYGHYCQYLYNFCWKFFFLFSDYHHHHHHHHFHLINKIVISRKKNVIWFVIWVILCFKWWWSLYLIASDITNNSET